MVFRPDDERFRVDDKATLHSAGLTPSDELYRAIAAKLEGAEASHRLTLEADDVLHIPVHDLPPILREFVRVLPVEVAKQASLRGVERVPVAQGTRADELADEPQLGVDDDENRQAYEDENEYDPMENGSLTYPECPVLCEQPLKIRHGSPFRTKCRLRGGSLPRLSCGRIS